MTLHRFSPALRHYVRHRRPTISAPPQTMAALWIEPAALAALPMTGSIWTSVINAANSAPTTGANLADLNSSHDVTTFAIALAAARNGDSALYDKAVAAMTNAIDTEGNIRWLEIGRNLGGYILAADILNIRTGIIFDWLESFMYELRPHNNTGVPETIQDTSWSNGSNASAQMGWVHAALSVYLNLPNELAWNWTAYRRYVGDRSSPVVFVSNNGGNWEEIPSDVVGIQSLGAVKAGVNIDGAVSNDMSRGSGSPTATPIFTDYPWVGLQGAVLAAEVLYRQGYNSYSLADAALHRAATYLLNLVPQNAGWYNSTARKDVKWLLNKRYGIAYPVGSPVGASGLAGFTDFTMP